MTNQFLKSLAAQEVRFPEGEVGKASLTTLRRKLNRYRDGGFDALARKKRRDRGLPRNISQEVTDKAIELKKEQPYRNPSAINRFLQGMYGMSVPRATLYRHLKRAGTTRLKLGVTRQKIRKRWTRDHTHDLWVGILKMGRMFWKKGLSTDSKSEVKNETTFFGTVIV